jgi:hypothetical protein
MWFEDATVRDTTMASITAFFQPGDDLDAFVRDCIETQRERIAQFSPEDRLSGCKYCEQGCCRSDLACHVTSVANASAIIESGRILSACKARGLPGEALVDDPGNAAGDPPDYFEYVMLGAGNCTAVDKLVLERALGHVPSWEEFEKEFQPGVRFFFRTEDLRTHPRYCFDGIHGKIHEELELDPYLLLLVIPDGLPGSEELTSTAMSALPAGKVWTHPFKSLSFREWAQTAYQQAQTGGSHVHC